jgi:hypothetical protein
MMDQDTPTNRGFGATSATDFGTTSRSNTGVNTGADSGVCDHCGQPLGQNRALQQFLGKVGINEEMMNALMNQMQNIDVEQYLNTARDYLKNTGEKAKTYSKDHPGQVAAAGVAVLVGAGLLINAMREK